MIFFILMIFGTSLSAMAANVKVSDSSAEEARVQASIAKEKRILNQYSLEELNSAGTYLLAVFESSLDAKKAKILDCDPPADKAQLWLSGPLHALIDEKTEIEAKSVLKNVEKELTKTQKKWHACAEQCQCATYMAIVEQAQNLPLTTSESAHSENTKNAKSAITHKLSTQDQNRLKIASELLTKENEKQKPQTMVQCASHQNWFCKSPLESYLKEAAED